MALADALHGLLRLPGATYSCIVERDTGRVLAEVGQGEGGVGDGEGVVPYSVARWGTAVAAMFDATSGDELDDVMITGRRSYHLVRSVGARASVLVYLRLDRTRANLAAARRELAAVRWGAGAGAATASRAPTAAAGPDGPRRTEPPPSGTVRHGGGTAGAETRAASSRTPGPARPTAVATTRVPAALPPGTPARGLPVEGRAAPASGPVPPPEPTDPGPRAPAPQIPLPRRAPTQRSSGQRSAAARSSDGSSRRRAAGRGAGAPASPMEASSAPEGFAMPTVLGQTWARDPGTLRRLIAGLRRMS